MTDAGTTALRSFFQKLAPHLVDSIVAVMAPRDPDTIREEATAAFEQLIPQTPYVDRPDHVMAESMYFCMAALAFKGPLENRGYDVHDLGRAVLDIARRNLEGADPEQDPSRAPEAMARLRRDALESQNEASPDEFVFEIIDGEGDVDYGMNIKSCAICKAYSKHNAMDLVPYMCASDDVVSEALDRGLQRTGTIALGAHQCDFRFQRGGPGRALANQYPNQIIRWID